MAPSVPAFTGSPHTPTGTFSTLRITLCMWRGVWPPAFSIGPGLYLEGTASGGKRSICRRCSGLMATLTTSSDLQREWERDEERRHHQSTQYAYPMCQEWVKTSGECVGDLTSGLYSPPSPHCDNSWPGSRIQIRSWGRLEWYTRSLVCVGSSTLGRPRGLWRPASRSTRLPPDEGS